MNGTIMRDTYNDTESSAGNDGKRLSEFNCERPYESLNNIALRNTDSTIIWLESQKSMKLKRFYSQESMAVNAYYKG